MNQNKANGNWDADDEYEGEDRDGDGDGDGNREQSENTAVEELLEDLYRKVGFEVMENEMRKNLEPLPGVHSPIESAVAAVMDAEHEAAREATMVKAAKMRATVLLVTSRDFDSDIESDLPEENTSSEDELDDDAVRHADKLEVLEEYISSEEGRAYRQGAVCGRLGREHGRYRRRGGYDRGRTLWPWRGPERGCRATGSRPQ